ncbi:hypothetical protein [Marivirga harenae]|uniref:hypothetical protein n=1 Tax=Marivirga harenae TaxID=2010992 RepID=UPI0026E0DA18|nr:hypothetical protein [Marivirga harenae]WKV13504.1 hypothetical protein Q3Y49_06645 [Marivirga harenae]
MSSHHIIRDEQEPPVLVFELFDNWNEISELLAWSPILLIDPQMEEVFSSKQTKVDGFLVSQEEEVDIRDAKSLVYNSSNLAWSINKWAEGKKYTAIYIFCDSDLMSKLIDDKKAVKFLIPIIFFTDNGKYTLIPNYKFRKWYPKNYKIDILNNDIVAIENLSKDGKGFYLEKDGFIKIEVEGDFILIKEK